MTIRVGGRVRISPDRAADYRQPFRDWIAAGRPATVTHIINGCRHYHPHAEIAFSDLPQDRMIEAIEHLIKSDKPGEIK